MKTKYEVKHNEQGEEYCVTPCPLGRKIHPAEIRIMAGSCNCQKCKYFVKDDQENQVIMCAIDKYVERYKAKQKKAGNK